MKNKKRWVLRLVLSLLSIFAIGIIFYQSSLPADESMQESGRLLAWINSVLGAIHPSLVLDQFIVRKAAHFTEYFCLGCLLFGTFYAYLSKRLRALLCALSAGLIVAVCDEMIQTVSEGRSCELRDIMIDCSGVLCGALIILFIISLVLSHKRKRKVKHE